MEDEKPSPLVVADELRTMRERLEMDHRHLARHLMVPPKTIERWESGGRVQSKFLMPLAQLAAERDMHDLAEVFVHRGAEFYREAPSDIRRRWLGYAERREGWMMNRELAAEFAAEAHRRGLTLTEALEQAMREWMKRLRESDPSIQ
jgi:transcriptional regulator with XRE-family HTH domain